MHQVVRGGETWYAFTIQLLTTTKTTTTTTIDFLFLFRNKKNIEEKRKIILFTHRRS